MEASEREIGQIIVLGAGAVGSFYGALLSRKFDVLLIGRKSHVNAINSRGLVVSGAMKRVFHVKASEELKIMPDNSLIILTTKAQDSVEALKPIKPLLKPSVTMLVLQNGIGNEELVRRVLSPRVEVLRGLCSSAIEFMSPGGICVKHVKETVLPKTSIGGKIKRMFDSCGLETRLSDEMNVEIWRKLTINCVINPLTAIFRLPNNEIASGSLAEVKRRIVGECIEVARREGVNLDPISVDQIDAVAASYFNLSSMCQDILKGRKTEIDFLNGRVSELGRKHLVDTPANDIIVAFIRFMEGKSWTLKN